jgi:hypothetical protein
MRLDSKVHGTLFRNKDDSEVPEDEFVVFRPHDDALPSTLRYYRLALEQLGASAEQLSATDALIDRVNTWRLHHPHRCKTPDVAPGELREE